MTTTRTPAQTCREAAAILERDANDLQASHTVHGRWVESKMDELDKGAKAECERNRALARELRAIARKRCR